MQKKIFLHFNNYLRLETQQVVHRTAQLCNLNFTLEIFLKYLNFSDNINLGPRRLI